MAPVKTLGYSEIDAQPKYWRHATAIMRVGGFSSSTSQGFEAIEARRRVHMLMVVRAGRNGRGGWRVHEKATQTMPQRSRSFGDSHTPARAHNPVGLHFGWNVLQAELVKQFYAIFAVSSARRNSGLALSGGMRHRDQTCRQ